MAPDLAGPQISALLETVPGIANVLRSPVADAMISLVRAGAGLGDFRLEDAEELLQYAVRRGLIGSAESERVLEEVRAAAAARSASKAPAKVARRGPPARKRPAARRNGKVSKKRR